MDSLCEALAPGGGVEVLVGFAGSVGDEFVVGEGIGDILFHFLREKLSTFKRS
jgi:hypothetical protein